MLANDAPGESGSTMNGWTGKILRVDLSARTSGILCLSADIYRQYIGGRGLAGYFLRQSPQLPWDDPQMPLMLFTGPLTGTVAPASGHVIFAARSPLTNGAFDESVGGALGTQLKAAGLDGLVITGMGDSWTGLEINDDVVRFSDATHLVPMSISRATQTLNPTGALAMIGPAAHRGVRFAGVAVDEYFAAARGGLGLCFAQKKLKYISVSGQGRPHVVDSDALDEAREDILRLTSASSILQGENGISRLGTAALFDLIHTRRMMPTANFRQTFFAHAARLNAAAIRDTGVSGFECAGCHIGCRRKSTRGEPIPDYETLAHFSALLENDSLEIVLAANTLCGELGIDPVSAASVLACHAEIRNQKLTGDDIIRLLEDIGAGTGAGAALGQGSVRYARDAGRPECAMAVKGLALPAYDPRGAYGLALGYAVSTRGGCHLRSYPLSHEILRKPVATDRFSFSGKARIIKIAEDQNAMADSLTVCRHIFLAASMAEYARALEAVTGVSFTVADLSLVGARISYGERILNARFGLVGADDDLPERFFTDAGTSGPAFDVPPIDRESFLAARQRYFRVRGLDADGMPRREMADELELVWNSW